jgi:hypothetical protein
VHQVQQKRFQSFVARIRGVSVVGLAPEYKCLLAGIVSVTGWGKGQI